MSYTTSRYRIDSRDLRLAKELSMVKIMPLYVHNGARIYWISGPAKYLVTWPDKPPMLVLSSQLAREIAHGYDKCQSAPGIQLSLF